jgi:hypothetical protein
MIAVCQSTAITVDTNIDKTLDVLAATPKPWFLKSEELYLVAKKALEDLKLNDFAAVQHSISLIDKSTASIMKSSDAMLKTNFSTEEGFSLINTIDSVLTSIFILPEIIRFAYFLKCYNLSFLLNLYRCAIPPPLCRRQGRCFPGEAS